MHCSSTMAEKVFDVEMKLTDNISGHISASFPSFHVTIKDPIVPYRLGIGQHQFPIPNLVSTSKQHISLLFSWKLFLFRLERLRIKATANHFNSDKPLFGHFGHMLQSRPELTSQISRLLDCARPTRESARREICATEGRAV